MIELNAETPEALGERLERSGTWQVGSARKEALQKLSVDFEQWLPDQTHARRPVGSLVKPRQSVHHAPIITSNLRLGGLQSALEMETHMGFLLRGAHLTAASFSARRGL